MSAPEFFVTGGAMQIDASSYVERTADGVLIRALQQGEFCYVLTSRQMGKSSLMVRAAAHLREQGFTVVVLDLTAIGQNLDVEQWYFSMLCHVGEKLGLEAEMEEYWDANARRSPLDRWMGAIREVYLERKRKPLVIFIDEIDAVRSLRQFSADEFFAGIRECFNRRTEDPKLSRLTFCLLGVAMPSDLIRDQTMTPFNIGRAIELEDFASAEAEALAAGLSPHRETALHLLHRVLHWTSGHPYLTQKLCAEAARARALAPRDIDQVCARIFLSAEARDRDENLHFVRDRVLRSELDRSTLLDVYCKVCRGARMADDHLDPIINELRLSGIVRVVDGSLRPRNRIYATVFDLAWARASLPDAERRRQRDAFYRGVRRVVGVAALILAFMGWLVATTMSSLKGEKQAKLAAQESAESAEKSAWEATEAALKERAAAERARLAREESQRQMQSAQAALDRLAITQEKITVLLESLAPLVGDQSGLQVLARAEEVVAAISQQSANDGRVRVGEASLRRACARLYVRLGNRDAARSQAEIARNVVEAELLSRKDDRALKLQLHDCYLLLAEAEVGSRAGDAIRKANDGGYERAFAAHRTAVDFAKTQTGAQDSDGEWRRLFFTGLNRLGDVARLYDRTDQAEQILRDALREVEKEPAGTPGIGLIEAAIRDRLGALLMSRDKMELAHAEFDRSLVLREANAQAAPEGDLESQSDLATTYNKLGNVAYDRRDFAKGLEFHQRSLKIREQLAERSTRLDWQRNLGFSLYNVALGSWRLKHDAEALAGYERRLEFARKLADRDPSDADLRSDLARAFYGFADFLINVETLKLRDWPRAQQLVERAVALSGRRDPQLLSVLAQSARLNKDFKTAVAAAEEAHTMLPPPNERSALEREMAKNIEFELMKARAGAARKPPAEKSDAPSARGRRGG